MDDAELARLEHANMLEWLRIEVGGVEGGLVRTEAGVAVFASGLPVALFNEVVTSDGATDADLRSAVELVRERGVPFYVVFRRGPDDRFGAVAVDLGLTLDDGVMPGMAIHPLPTELAVVPAGLEIQPVADVSGMDAFIRVATAGFHIPRATVRAFIGADLWRRPDVAAYVGLADGQPATIGLGVRTGRTIGVYWIATVPEARGRGYGAALTRRIIADGAAAGCDVATLEASAMGLPVYERIGFRTVVGYDVYLG